MAIADLSHYQGTVNWKKAREELEMVILRASCGDYADNKYLDYAAKCNIPFGAYHFVKAGNKAQAKTEAKYFYKCATKNGLNPLFFVADIEYKTQTTTTTNDVTTAFAETLRELGCNKIGLYIGQSRYKYANRKAYDFIWIPRYGKDTGKVDKNCKPVYPCDLWQFTSKGRVSGINGNVDLNVIMSDKDVEWYTGGAVKPEEKGLVVTSDKADIRKEDNPEADVILTVFKGATLQPYLNKNGNPMVSGNGWYVVHADGETGWVECGRVRA